VKTRSFLILASLAAACSKSPAPADDLSGTSTTGAAPAAPTATGDPVATAKKIFTDRCVPCHGASGQGDGPASASLNPKPRKYADADWQASVTDEYIEKIIKFGGAAVGKSPAMPNNPDINDPAVLTALKDIIRAFGKK